MPIYAACKANVTSIARTEQRRAQTTHQQEMVALAKPRLLGERARLDSRDENAALVAADQRDVPQQVVAKHGQFLHGLQGGVHSREGRERRAEGPAHGDTSVTALHFKGLGLKCVWAETRPLQRELPEDAVDLLQVIRFHPLRLVGRRRGVDGGRTPPHLVLCGGDNTLSDGWCWREYQSKG